jgi:L-arabinose transport system substrate-binding protein
MPEEMWFQNETEYAKECAADYGFHLIAIGTPDGEKVLTAIDSLAANGAKGFVICTPDVRLGPAIYSRALQHDMKVLAVDDQFIAADGGFMQEVPFMGCAAWDIGRTVAKELYKEFKNRAWNIEETAACGITFDELDCVKQRTDATVSTLLELGFPQDRIYRIGEKTTDIPGAFDVANIVLAQHPEVKRWLVFSVNDEGVLGAVRAMEGRGFDADYVIGIGIGAGVGFTEFEKQKPTGFFGTVVMNNRRHGYETTELLYKWVTQGRQPPSQTKTPGFMTTRDTYKQVMKELGMGNLVQ